MLLLISGSTQAAAPQRYIIFWESPGFKTEDLMANFSVPPEARIRIGVQRTFSLLNEKKPGDTANALAQFLAMSESTGTPVVVALDLKNWWGNRPDLWNFWDAAKPGYNPKNRENVEWTNWSSESAVKICWRNWGRQVRISPAPNIHSPRYRSELSTALSNAVPVVSDWFKRLPEEKKYLLAAVRVGWEESIGINDYHFPNGNDYLDKPQENDPARKSKEDPDDPDVTKRGLVQIGFAAVKNAGIKSSGTLTHEDIGRAVKIHLTEACRLVSELGIPRDRMFTHAGGWVPNDPFYRVAVNRHACPGWSFYKYAPNPAEDADAMGIVKQSDAPYWAAVEWLARGNADKWKAAIDNAFADPKCRYIGVCNWRQVMTKKEGDRRALFAMFNHLVVASME